MYKFLTIFFPFVFTVTSVAAQPYFDNLHLQYKNAKDDTSKVLALCALARYHEYIRSDSNIYYVRKAIDLSQKINYPFGKFVARRSMFFAVNLRANYTKALEIALENLRIAGELKTDRLYYMALIHLNLALVNREMGNQQNQINETQQAFLLQEKSGSIDGDFWGAFSNKALSYLTSQPDSAVFYAHKGYELAKLPSTQKQYMCLATAMLGDVYTALRNYPSARQYYSEALQQCMLYNNVYIEARIFRDLARLFNKMGSLDSCLHFAQLSLKLCQEYNFGDYASNVGQLLAGLYESQHKPDSALKYIKVMQAARDSIFSQANIQQFQLLIFDDEQKQREMNLARERFQNQLKLYGLLSIVSVFILLTIILYRTNRQRKKAYLLLRNQKQQTDSQKQKAEDALEELKTAQNQLIQSEKMASLGELMAGIAHEIQNPLNFVNNFSEVNKELIDEASQAIVAGNPDEAKESLSLIRENEEKISHHGKRADAIVKGMLQHSRASTGQKESTDINALADEYLRLSYLGLRAKDKSFNATIQTNFDSTIGEINIVPQDIGRVLLNLYNNAFYSIAEKKKQQPEGYEPAVLVSTKKISNKIEISVRDNGMGVPKKVSDKIFQPFFTTKPAGQGTGLGLSLSYDIIKAHGGEIKMNTRGDEFTEFIVLIPG
jgi:two-component system NtrC family sensor kinase